MQPEPCALVAFMVVGFTPRFKIPLSPIVTLCHYPSAPNYAILFWVFVAFAFCTLCQFPFYLS